MPPCIFGAPEWPAASAVRLIRVCVAIHEGSCWSPRLETGEFIVLSKVRLRAPDMRMEACGDGTEVLRQSMDCVLTRGSVPSICAATAVWEQGELGSSGGSYHEPSLPLPRLLCPRPPLLYGWITVELNSASVAGNGRLNCWSGVAD
mmetsp:Transcript_23049/g.54608  ORF Transcript_23049/g.54608 Transcript_23049/m.54608 type:complete len:147 (-) Transcript_23049:317-757(-)